jgi:RNA polymerase sigma-70 factor (ECF subfamily)
LSVTVGSHVGSPGTMSTAALTPTDEILVHEALADDRRAFEALIERHMGMVYAIACARLRDRDRAEDLTQEVFLRAFLALPRLDHPERFGAWLCRITRNLAVNWLRRDSRVARLVPQVPFEDAALHIPDTHAKGARQRMEASEREKALWEALLQLPTEEREAVLLHYSEDLSTTEISRRLGVHQTTVRRRLHRALANMRGLLVPVLRESAPAMRAPRRLTTRTFGVIAAAAAMTAASKAALAAKATQEMTALGQAPLAAAGLAACLQGLFAALLTGGKIMATGKGVAATVAAAAVITGAVHWGMASETGRAGPAPAEVALHQVQWTPPGARFIQQVAAQERDAPQSQAIPDQPPPRPSFDGGARIIPVREQATSDTQALVRALLDEGQQAYSAGDVVGAVEKWNRALALDPTNDYARVYLAQTADEYRGAVAMRRAESERASREARTEAQLLTPITITTPPEGTPLQVFLNNISVFTELNFVIAQGIDVQVTGSFADQPLRQVLDSVADANGLSWEVQDGVVAITSELQTRFFQLTSDQAASLKVMQDSGFLDQLLYPPDGVRRVAGETYELNDVTGTFVVTGTGQQMRRMDELLSGLTTTPSPNVLVTRMYRVNATEGERIKTLVQSILEAERTPQTQGFDRTIILQGENLVVRATEPEQRRVEEILRDYAQPGQGLAERGLEVATFSLIPRRVLQQNEEVARDLAEQIKETVEVLLYSGEGVDAARREGRRLWFDEYTLQLTLTDTPENIERVTRYISSIPTLEPRRTTRIVNLNHQQASTLVGKLQDFLDIEIRGAGEGQQGQQQGGDVIVRTLRADDEFTFRDLRVTLVDVVENDPNNDRDEDVTLLIDTPTTSEERTIKELRSEIVDNYRVRIVDARASGNRPNSGRAEIEITYLGANGGVGGPGLTGGAAAGAVAR